MNYPHVSIVILNWNGSEDTVECLEAVYKIKYPNYNIILLDNASTDESLEKIRGYLEGKIKVNSPFFEYARNKPIKFREYLKNEIESLKNRDNHYLNKELIIIKNDENYGFTEGNNIGIRYALNTLNSDYILLLNNDTVVDECFLDELITVAESDQKIGFVGPKVYYYDYRGRKNVINFAGGKQNLWKFKPSHIGYKEIDNGQYNTNHEVDYIHGCCILARAQMIRDIGLLDKEYISYREENDWAIRGYNCGWKSVYVYKSKMWHKIGGSTNRSTNLFVDYLETKNRFLFVKKHSNNWQTLSFLLYFFVFDFWFISAIDLIYFKSLKRYKSFLKATKDGIKILRT
jgi:GT2 family glycosyltransferase